jgi:hypothetical protein
MKNKTNKKQDRKQKPPSDTKSMRSLGIWVAVIVGATIVFILWWNNTSTPRESASTSDSSPVTTPAKAEKDQLIGRWTRTDSDGAYVIEIKSATADGKLEASYFNPNPIKVGRAEWQNKNGKLAIEVELRDINYPGSTYTLNFHPKENKMTGNYYQAVEGTNFDVEFVPAH